MYRKLYQTADQIEAVLRDRKAPAAVVGGKVLPGFVEMLLRPAPGTKVNQVRALQAENLEVPGGRISHRHRPVREREGFVPGAGVQP